MLQHHRAVVALAGAMVWADHVDLLLHLEVRRGGLPPMNEQELRRHIDEVHRQLLERDNVYRFHEAELRNRDLQIQQLRLQLAETRAWAQKLEASIREMQATRAWRFAVWLRSRRASARRLVTR